MFVHNIKTNTHTALRRRRFIGLIDVNSGGATNNRQMDNKSRVGYSVTHTHTTHDIYRMKIKIPNGKTHTHRKLAPDFNIYIYVRAARTHHMMILFFNGILLFFGTQRNTQCIGLDFLLYFFVRYIYVKYIERDK